MDFKVRKVTDNELDEAFMLIWNTFIEFVAPDYSKEGIDTFRINYIENENFKNSFMEGRQIMYCAYSEEKLVGVVSISRNNNISCFFVDKQYHRNGIATMLFNNIISELREKKVEKIILNASPYAVPFYHAIGFKDIDKQCNFKGIIYTPMEFIIV